MVCTETKTITNTIKPSDVYKTFTDIFFKELNSTNRIHVGTKAYKVIDFRLPTFKDTWFGTDGVVYEMFAGFSPRFILEEVIPEKKITIWE